MKKNKNKKGHTRKGRHMRSKYCVKFSGPNSKNWAGAGRSSTSVVSCPVRLRGLDSPSKDAANWLSSRFSRSVEMQQRFGWLKMVLIRCASSEP